MNPSKVEFEILSIFASLIVIKSFTSIVLLMKVQFIIVIFPTSFTTIACPALKTELSALIPRNNTSFDILSNLKIEPLFVVPPVLERIWTLFTERLKADRT